MNLLSQYIGYLLKGKGRHGIHSPFVYSFVNECLHTKVAKKFLNTRKNLFKKLINSHKTIEIKDFGAGSKKLGTSRKISSIFKIGSSRGKYGLLLYRLSNYYRPSRILELGTSLGIGTIHLSHGNSNAEIISVEGCAKTMEAAKENFKMMECENIQTILSTFHTFISSYQGEKFDMVFIDGHHDGKALLDYMNLLSPMTHENTLFILDDIRWSDSMYAAWTQLTLDPAYHLSIDLFRLGIISRRPQQMKEHFVISY